MNILIATFADNDAELRNSLRLSGSLRTFGGRYRNLPLRVYTPDRPDLLSGEFARKLQAEGTDIKSSSIPADAAWFYYSGKVYAAAQAEQEAESEYDILVWLDEDTIIMSEPTAFALPPEKSFAYCPVMHNRTGVLLDSEPNAFWARVYELSGVDENSLFPMTTPADQQHIKAYFHAGLLVVRPERGLLRGWAANYERLFRDSQLRQVCENDPACRIFLHQTALIGPVLKTMHRDKMTELPGTYNYPFFFERQFDAARSFDSIQDAVTLRHVVTEKNLGPNWPNELTGPPEKIAWLKEHIAGSKPG